MATNWKFWNLQLVAVPHGDELDFLVRRREATNWIFQFVAGDKQDFGFCVAITQEFEMN